MDTSINSAQERATAKDFFLHLGAVVALYVVVGNFLNLIFRVIDRAYPDMITNSYYWSQGSEISFPVATLIIVFPLFIFLSRLIHKTYEESPAKKELGVRKWLTYITLFVAGVMLAGDLVIVLYKFLDGQDLTLAFLLKALAVLLVSGAVFGFYLSDIRDRVSLKMRNIWAIVTGVIILASIILGFVIIGSPKTQRLLRYDNQKVMDLQNLQWQVINYWQVNGVIPDSMPNIQIDSQTGKPYEYKKIDVMSFELCAEFNNESMIDPNQPRMMGTAYPEKGGMIQNDNWNHKIGRTCFERIVDPVAYPTQVRG